MERFLKSKLENGEFVGVTPTRSRIMSSIRGKSNRSTERILRSALIRAGIRGWKLHAANILGRPDFFFPEQNVAVFVDGCFWHGCARCGHVPKPRSDFWKAKIQRNRERDLKTTNLLLSNGTRTLRVWEHVLRSPERVRGVVRRIQRTLGS